jgi:RNA recognition motif-containing protein
MNNLPPLPPPLPPGPAPLPHKKAPVRTAAGKTWVDESLADWPDNDFRLFVGNLPPEITDEQLYQHFEAYPSLQRSRVVCNQKGVSKGYGFVSFIAPLECAKALREMDQTWLGSRPIRIKRSSWKDRDWKEVRKNESKNNKQRKRMGLL